ncbi:hypothetical protein TNCV_3670841 [Trichonephila clavipes]|nr:hypothetical protein TNCV_3670841 [Trichonephila clavipes]
MINGRTCLHVVANGTMMGQRYIDEVLLPHVRLFRGAVGDKFVFMDDNATCHRTLAVQDCLHSEDSDRNYPPTNKNTLIRALTEEWDKLPQQLLDNVVQSMVITPVPTAANWSHCSLYPATNQIAVTKLSAKSKTYPNSPSRRSTEATPPGSHRSSNRRHST